MNLRRWLHEHSLKLLAIRDTPGAIAGGVAIGFFVGFTPLFGLKTVLAIFLAWVTRTNVIAAIIAIALHDLTLLFMPVVYIWEYKIGFMVLNGRWPDKLSRVHLSWSEWRNWRMFWRVVWPTMVGSIFCGVPPAVLSFFLVRGIIVRHRLKKQGATEGLVPKD
ncbi:MAG: DUF2062 domain-containing protein [Verrucomicrobiota bacterium]